MGDSNFDTIVATAVQAAITGGVTGNVAGNVTGNVTGQITTPTVARTATADGLTTAIIAAAGLLQFVTVTSANATHIVVLPPPTPGAIVVLAVAANGYELRSSAPATVLINDGTGGAAVQSSIPANSMVIAVCKDATHWAAIQLAGTTLAAVEAAA